MRNYLDDAGETFDKWFYTDVTPQMLDQLSKKELAELAWRASANTYTTRYVRLTKPLADPDLIRLARVLAWEPNDGVHTQ